jgi:hypothetical protein
VAAVDGGAIAATDEVVTVVDDSLAAAVSSFFSGSGSRLPTIPKATTAPTAISTASPPPGGLILGNVLASVVHDLSGFFSPGKGRSAQWSPYRYAAYLEWRHQAATRIEAEPDKLKLTLFGLLKSWHSANVYPVAEFSCPQTKPSTTVNLTRK